MTWIIFDEADRRRPIPYFCLPSILGRPVALDHYRGRDNLVVFLPSSLDHARSREILRAFAGSQHDFHIYDAVLLAIFPEELEMLKEDAELVDLPFPVLSDPGGRTRQKLEALMSEDLVSDGDALLFVLDQYGAPYSALIEREFNDPAFQKDIYKWLEYIGMQCPE